MKPILLNSSTEIDAFSRIMEQGILGVLLVMCILGLMFFIRMIYKDKKEAEQERKEFREYLIRINTEHHVLIEKNNDTLEKNNQMFEKNIIMHEKSLSLMDKIINKLK